MKPVNLKFCGFNSFSEPVEINFEKLIKSGLFGIFGKTGSGKSTILDCIMYALFGRSSRKNSSIKEYVNNKGRSAYVDFTFEILDGGKRNTYNVKRTIKLNKKDIPETTVSLSIWDEDGFRPLDGDVNLRIKNIVGVGYEEFSKCIILPQNEFASFVKSAKVGRITLVSKLFSLERYDEDLNRKLKTRIQDLTVELSGIEGEVKQYDGYTKQYLEERKTAQNAQNQLILKLKDESADLKKYLDANEGEYSDKQLYDKNKIKLNELYKAKEVAEDYKIKLLKRQNGIAVSEALNDKEEKKKNYLDLLDRFNKLNNKYALAEQNLILAKAENAKDRQGEIEKLSAFIAKMESELSLASDIESLVVEYKKTNAQRMDCERKIDRLRCEKEDFLAQFEKMSDPKPLLDELFVKAGATAIRNELSSQTEYFISKKSQLEEFSSNSLYPIIVREIDEKINEIQLRLLQLPEGESVHGLEEELEKFKKRSEKFSALKDGISSLEASLIVEKTRLESLLREEERLKTEGGAKRSVLKKLSEEIGFDVSSSSLLKAGIEKLKNDVLVLKRDLANFSDKERQYEKEVFDIGIAIATEKEKLCVLENESKIALKIFEDTLENSSFKSIDEALLYALDDKTVSEYNLYIENFEKDLLASKTLDERLFNRLSLSGFNADEFEKAKEKYTALLESIGIEEGELRLINRDVIIAEQKIEEAKELNEKRDAIKYKLGLCEKLSEVLVGHNLLNFISEEYLSDISFGASRTLLMLTGGRFDLVYDNEFFVLDNLNCGERRPVSTLSGGETFLVSLSLALSLSQAICENTMRPVEFFFLDEGFGTLDSDLTDVVLNSLEKLKGEHFSIGLISHVPELKQRIPCKILVTPATASAGSKIEVIC